MFSAGFEKVAMMAPKGLAQMTGAAAAKPFAKPMGTFGRRPRTGLMSITRLKDGFR